MLAGFLVLVFMAITANAGSSNGCGFSYYKDKYGNCVRIKTMKEMKPKFDYSKSDTNKVWNNKSNYNKNYKRKSYGGISK